MFSGSNVSARTLRSTLWVVLNFGGNSILLRLISSLVLTRLLFPEAFGLMALTQVFLTGLRLFSDTGVRTSIVQSKRGEEDAFLNTAWTVQILRGALLWMMTFLIAIPVARLYDEPTLAQMLPCMGITLFLNGFHPTAVYLANRHLQMGRVISIDLIVAVISALWAWLLAFLLQSVWALVISSVSGSLLTLVLYWTKLPGAGNRLQIDRSAFGELFHFGKYIFLSSIAAFVVTQSDRAILGLYIPIAALGVFNIGYALAMLPVNLVRMVQNRVILPLYRLKPISESADNRTKVFRARRLLAAGMIGTGLALAIMGPWLIAFLYDDRYLAAGPMVTLFGLAIVPMLSMTSTGPMLLAMGDSRSSLIIQILTAVLQTVLLFVGIRAFGVVGAILAPGLAILLSGPLRWHYARRYNGWDPVQEVGLTSVGLLAGLAICLWHREAIFALLP